MKPFIPLDDTQREIAGHLRVTERLLAQATTRVSGCEQTADIWAMPDLGLPRSVQRALGGFHTGMLARWTCREPFVPVDATVNVCAVGVYPLGDRLASPEAFEAGLVRARSRGASGSSYQWNFAEGNHFIIVAETEGGGGLPSGRYLVLHASASEFKRGHNGLYPSAGNWYADRIEEIVDPETGRSLRFLRGNAAERFFRLADGLVEFNRLRLHYFAEQIAGGELLEWLYQPHYGMPDQNAVAIGCQWLRPGESSLLLSRRGAPLYLVEPLADPAFDLDFALGRRRLMPHGLGVEVMNGLRLCYVKNGLEINGQVYGPGGTFKGLPGLATRGCATPADEIVARVLQRANGRMLVRLQQKFFHCG